MTGRHEYAVRYIREGGEYRKVPFFQSHQAANRFLADSSVRAAEIWRPLPR